MAQATTARKPASRGHAGRASQKSAKPTEAQRKWLSRGLKQPGGKLPLFDENGRRVDSRIVQACLDKGWADHWFTNPLKPDWQVCKLTDTGRAALE